MEYLALMLKMLTIAVLIAAAFFVLRGPVVKLWARWRLRRSIRSQALPSQEPDEGTGLLSSPAFWIGGLVSLAIWALLIWRYGEWPF